LCSPRYVVLSPLLPEGQELNRSFRFPARPVFFHSAPDAAGKIAVTDVGPLVDRLIVESQLYLANASWWSAGAFSLATARCWCFLLSFSSHGLFDSITQKSYGVKVWLQVFSARVHPTR